MSDESRLSIDGPTGPEEGPRRRASVFIDADNILLGARAAGFDGAVASIMELARDQWFVMTARAYGDWTQSPCLQHLKEFQLNSVQMMQLPTSRHGKNTADIMLAVEAVDMALSTAAPDVVVLAAADRDFVPLAQMLRRHAKEVIGIGVRGSVSPELQQACNEFIMLDDIVADTSVPDAETQAPESGEAPAETPAGEDEGAPDLGPDAAFRLLTTAVNQTLNPNRYALGGQVAQRLRELMPGGSYADYGFGSFRSFCLAAQKRGLIHVFQSNRGDMRLAPPVEGDEMPELDLSFDTVEDACTSYRTILLVHMKEPVLGSKSRRMLVKRLCDELERRPDGMSISDMQTLLIRHARDNAMSQPDQAINKLVGTLNAARCFTDGSGPGRYRDHLNTLLRLACSYEEALAAINEAYARWIYGARTGVPLKPEALAALFFEGDATDHLAEMEALVAKVTAPRPKRKPRKRG